LSILQPPVSLKDTGGYGVLKSLKKE